MIEWNIPYETLRKAIVLKWCNKLNLKKTWMCAILFLLSSWSTSTLAKTLKCNAASFFQSRSFHHFIVGIWSHSKELCDGSILHDGTLVRYGQHRHAWKHQTTFLSWFTMLDLGLLLLLAMNGRPALSSQRLYCKPYGVWINAQAHILYPAGWDGLEDG